MAHITEQHLQELVRRGRVSQADADRALGRAMKAGDPKQSKYHNVKTTLDGITFDSKREASRYLELKTAEKHGRVRNLRHHFAYALIVNGVKIADYESDFTFEEFSGGEWRNVVEDVKSAPTKTDSYRLKRRLMLALYNIEIREVM